MYTTLIAASDLGLLLDQAEAADGVVVLDCRHRLGEPEAGRKAYLAGHVPGAVFVDLNRDLAAPPEPRAEGHDGRHPLPDLKKWLRTVGALGLTPGAQAIAYDDAGGAYAARLWWMLRQVGHQAVAVLDGGIQAWTDFGGRLVEGEQRVNPMAPYPGRPRPDWIATYAEVRAVADGDPSLLLVDARDPARYRGDTDPVDSVPGHIPTAINAPFQRNLDASGRFLAPTELRERFASLLAGRPVGEMVSYCGSGVTACHNLLALEVAGMPGARLFPQSWSGWSRTPGLRVETGEPR